MFVTDGDTTRTTTITTIETTTSTTTATYTQTSATPPTAGGSSMVTVSGSLVVPSDSTTSVLFLDVVNTASYPVTGIIATFPTGTSGFTGNTATVTCMGETADGAMCTVGAIPFTLNGAVIQTSNSLPVGSGTSASTNVAQTAGVFAGGLKVGQVYTFSITVTFSVGNPQTLPFSITAQYS